MTDFQYMVRKFEEHYGKTSHKISCFFAPGRVNLIGEHTDYNGGLVFPAALTFGTAMAIRPRSDRMIQFISTNFSFRNQVSLENLVYEKSHDWTNYPKGIIVHLAKQGFTLTQGYDVMYHGEIPNGAGLSSSASIEVVTAYALMSMEGYAIDRGKLALLAQETENEYIGVKCGIMDQFVIANGKRNHALLLHCDSLSYSQIPLEIGEYKLVIGNTNKRRGLLDSKYNERRSECEQAVQILQTNFPEIQVLGQLSRADFESHQQMISDPTIRKRAVHVIEEINRVTQSAEVLKKGDLAGFGKLMIDSHQSLRYLYEVTGKELDAMVEAAWEVEGVLGARMTGAGFGGCTVAIVHGDQIETFKSYVGKKYEEQTGLVAGFYVAEIGDGVHEMKGV